MGICTDLFSNSDFGQIFPGFIYLNGKASGNILTEMQQVKGFLC